MLVRQGLRLKKQKISRVAEVVAFLAIAAIAGPSRGSSPDAPNDSFQQELQSVRSLQFARSAWWLNGVKLQGTTPVVLADNALAYATVELYGENLAAATEVDFLDDSGTQVEDVVYLPAGTSKEISRTLPILNATIRIRLPSDGRSVGGGRVIIKRAFGPPSEGDKPVSLTASLPLLSLFQHDPSDEKTKLFEVGRAVAFVQIAEPTATNACTGFLITKNIVATAAHCLREARSAETGSDWKDSLCRRIGIVFGLGRSDRLPGPNDKWSTHCKSVVYLDTEVHRVGTGHDVASWFDLGDVALLTVESSNDTGGRTPIPSALITGSPPARFRYTLVSIIQLPQGQPERVARDCAANSTSMPPLFVHHCATAPGSSGAPVLYYDGKGWVLVGMHTCCADQVVSSDTPEDLRDALKLENTGIDLSGLQKAWKTIAASPPSVGRVP